MGKHSARLGRRLRGWMGDGWTMDLPHFDGIAKVEESGGDEVKKRGSSCLLDAFPEDHDDVFVLERLTCLPDKTA